MEQLDIKFSLYKMYNPLACKFLIGIFIEYSRADIFNHEK